MNGMFATVVSGTLVYVTGQIIVKLLIDPLQEMRRLIGRIAHGLMYDTNLIVAPDIFSPERRVQAYKSLRGYASELTQQTHLIPGYDRLAYTVFVPRVLEILDATDKLILLSNRLLMNRGDVTVTNGYLMEQIQFALGIQEPTDKAITKAEFEKALRGETPVPWTEGAALPT